MTTKKASQKVTDKDAAPNASDDIFGPATEAEAETVEELVAAADDVDTSVESALDVAQLMQQVSDLKEKLKVQEEAVLRSLAEQDNTRRRSERDVSQARKFALEKFVVELFPIMDSLERALELVDTTDDSTKNMREGLELTLKMFADTLAKHGVKAVDPKGEAFDPSFHEAMTMQENSEVEPGTVLAVFQKGYQLNDRLVRPAKVVVAKAKVGG